MDDIPRQKLCEIISKYGAAICDDARRVEGLLRDLCGSYKRETFVLVSAMRERVPHELSNSSAGITKEVVIARLSKRLHDDLAMTEDVARWAVESWALALGIITSADVTRFAAHQAIQNRTGARREVQYGQKSVTTIPTTSANTTPLDSSLSVANKFSMEFVLIPAGSFMMGSENGFDSEKPVHQVTISKSFEMGKYEVTQAQWKAVMGNNPSHFRGCDDCPVEQVSWNAAQEFIKKLNAQNDGYKYRLPTEAEWEYSCRAGTTGDYAGELDSMAWYDENSGDKTHPVGTKKPNAFGLYDMHGNVWEWCQDWNDENYYKNSPSTDPKGPSTGSLRVYRGGGWSGDARDCRAANRGGGAPATAASISAFAFSGQGNALHFYAFTLGRELKMAVTA